MMRAIDHVVAGNRDGFQSQILALLALAILLVPANIGMAFMKGLFKRRAIVSAKKHYMDRIFKKEINKFQAENTSLYLSTLTNDVSNIESTYIDGLYEIVINTMNFIVGILVIAYVSPVALGVGLFLGIVGMLVSVVMSKPLEMHQSQRSAYYTDYTAYIKEFLSAFHIIKSNRLNQKVQTDFRKKSTDIQEKGYLIDRIISYISATQNFLMMFVMYGLLSFSVFMAIKGDLTLGGVILIVNNMEKIMFPLMQISEWLPKVLSSKGIFDKVDVLIEEEVGYEETIKIEGFNEAIALKSVDFSYDTQEVLSDVNLQLEKGKKYLIVGPSGGGKSTVLRLLRKYFNPTKGRIHVDENDLKDITKETYFHQIANIEQQVFVFEDTIRNNLCLYKTYEDEAIYSAIQSAGLMDFVSSDALGLERMLYDNGKNISGGERSRLAIARGLLQNAKIIILDEAFASLDGKVARDIERTILSLKDVTIINVSHVVFSETKSMYDQILMVKNKGVYAV
jgi:ATP-binding cassette subfamily C protein